MARRTYIPTIIGITQRLCQVLVIAKPIIVALYPTNTALITAVDAANAACSALNEEAVKVREFGD